MNIGTSITLSIIHRIYRDLHPGDLELSTNGIERDRLHVVHLGKYYPPSRGGIESHTQTLAYAQAKLGAEVHVLVVNHATPTGTDVTFNRLSSTTCQDDIDGPIRITRVGRWANVAKLDLSPRLPNILKQFLRCPPDIWHLHAPNVTMMLALLAERRIRPLIITHHSDIVRQRFTKYAVRPLERALYRRAARILPTSEAYAMGSELLPRYREKLTAVPLGIDQTSYREPNRLALEHASRFRQQFGSPLWLCVGRLIYYKGLHVALAALRDVPGKLLVIGTGPLAADLKARATELGVADRVIWFGDCTADELIGAYHAATALWFPSVARSEGFGLVQVEAMAAGCPVINTAVPGSGVSWVCRHESEGLTARVGDPAAFADAAKRLLNDHDLRTALIERARFRAAAEFDHLAMGQRTLDVYRSVLSKRRENISNTKSGYCEA